MPVRMHEVTDWIRRTWQAVPEFSQVHLIFDGIGISGTGSPDVVMLGDDGDPDTEVESEFTRIWADLAQTRKHEFGVIPCAVITNSGSTEQPVVEKRVFELLELAMSPIESDRTMGGLIFSSEISEGTKKTITNQAGTAVVVPFLVSYWAQA